MNRPLAVRLNGHSISIGKAVELINDAVNPDHSREIGARGILNELLMLIHAGQLIARVPISLAPVSTDTILPHELVNCVIFSEDLLPILRDKKIVVETGLDESPLDRAVRRLTRLRELGGDYVLTAGKWSTVGVRGALAKLTGEEKSAGHPKSDKSDVRRDLERAAVIEREGSSNQAAGVGGDWGT